MPEPALECLWLASLENRDVSVATRHRRVADALLEVEQSQRQKQTLLLVSFKLQFRFLLFNPFSLVRNFNTLFHSHTHLSSAHHYAKHTGFDA
jgi:hypothetical protein